MDLWIKITSFYTFVGLSLLLSPSISRFISSRIQILWQQQTQLPLFKLCSALLQLILPVTVIYLSQTVFKQLTGVETLIHLLIIYLYFLGSKVVLNSIELGSAYYETLSLGAQFPLKGLVQTAKLAVVILTIILMISQLIQQSPWYLISSLGALTALLLLIFKDAITGFVASMQITIFRLLAVGDWVDLPGRKISGSIQEVGLMVVKIVNQDNTLVSVPTEAFLQESFFNWRGTSIVKSRQIKRTFYLDQHSIQILSPDRLQQLQKNGLVQKETTESSNLVLLRQYLQHYVAQQNYIVPNKTTMVRLLQPMEKGIPIQIYTYCSEYDWVKFEQIQTELTEHIITQLAHFRLQLYQAEG